MLEVKLKGGDTLLFSCIYRSPTHNDQYVKMQSSLTNSYQVWPKIKDTLIDVSWETSIIKKLTGSNGTQIKMKIAPKKNFYMRYEMRTSINMLINLHEEGAQMNHLFLT